MTPDGPAEKAGLEIDDVVFKIGRQGRQDRTSNLTDCGRTPPSPATRSRLQLKRGDKAEMVEMVVSANDPPARAVVGGGGGGGFGGPGGGTSTRPNAANYGGQAANIQDQQGPGQPRVRRRLQVHRRRRNLDAHQQRQPAADVLQPDPRRSSGRQAISTCCGVSLARLTRRRQERSSSRKRGIHADQHALWIDPKMAGT